MSTYRVPSPTHDICQISMTSESGCHRSCPLGREAEAGGGRVSPRTTHLSSGGWMKLGLLRAQGYCKGLPCWQKTPSGQRGAEGSARQSSPSLHPPHYDPAASSSFILPLSTSVSPTAPAAHEPQAWHPEPPLLD